MVSTSASLPKHILNANILSLFTSQSCSGILFWCLLFHPEQKHRRLRLCVILTNQSWPFKIFLESQLCVVGTPRFQNGIKNCSQWVNTAQLSPVSDKLFMVRFGSTCFPWAQLALDLKKKQNYLKLLRGTNKWRQEYQRIEQQAQDMLFPLRILTRNDVT